MAYVALAEDIKAIGGKGYGRCLAAHKYCAPTRKRTRGRQHKSGAQKLPIASPQPRHRLRGHLPSAQYMPAKPDYDRQTNSEFLFLRQPLSQQPAKHGLWAVAKSSL